MYVHIGSGQNGSQMQSEMNRMNENLENLHVHVCTCIQAHLTDMVLDLLYIFILA